MTNRYDTTENSEGQYQLGSQDLVLLNKLDITDPEAIHADFGFIATANFPEVEQQVTYSPEAFPVSMDVDVAAFRITDRPEVSFFKNSFLTASELVFINISIAQ